MRQQHIRIPRHKNPRDTMRRQVARKLGEKGHGAVHKTRTVNQPTAIYIIIVASVILHAGGRINQSLTLGLKPPKVKSEKKQNKKFPFSRRKNNITHSDLYPPKKKKKHREKHFVNKIPSFENKKKLHTALRTSSEWIPIVWCKRRHPLFARRCMDRRYHTRICK